MAWVTEAMRAVWSSQRHLGRNRPNQVVRVRRGNYRHDYQDWPGPHINADLRGESASQPWYPIFTEVTPWIEIPNVASVEINKQDDQRGSVVATIGIDNVGYIEQTGPLGHVYRLIRRGWLSPVRGYLPPTRPGDGLEQNDWFEVVSENAHLQIWQGFGEPERDIDGEILDSGGANGAWMFSGFVDDVVPGSSPPSITVTARQGKQLTDERIFGYNKSVQIRDPITFIDRREADTVTEVGYLPKASSQSDATPPDGQGDDYGPANVLDNVDATEWRSAEHGADNVTEWASIRLPAGRYSDFRINTVVGQQIYVGVYPRPREDGDPCTLDDVEIPTGEWYDAGLGQVPGANGGWEYVRSFTAITGSDVQSLGGEFQLGKDSVLRIGVRDLVGVGGGEFAARVVALRGRRRRLSAQARRAKWILVDDISDMVRVALRWAGFQEWEVENTGARLPGKAVFNRSNYLIDIIQKAKDGTGFMFFIADPDTGSSFGIPTFRRGSHLLRNPGAVVCEVTDRNLLTDFTPKFTDESRAYIIRVRGKEASKQDGGRTLGGDKVRRIYASYRPPWTRQDKMAGIVKHVTVQNPAIRSVAGCKMLCYLIALEEALVAASGIAEIPAHPQLEIDDHVGVMDEGSGVNTRLHISGIRSTMMRSGKETTWKMTLQGSLLDSKYIVDVLQDIEDDATGAANSGVGDIGEYPIVPLVNGPSREPRVR